MADRFDKFDEPARRVMTTAQEEAHHFKHNYIGTEHLLLGLLHDGDSAASKVLAGCGVDFAAARSSVEAIIGSGDRDLVGEIGLTPRAKKALEAAVVEARALGDDHIGAEHLLLGLIAESNGIAVGVLRKLGAREEDVRAKLAPLLQRDAL